jgi:hypothetical protein
MFDARLSFYGLLRASLTNNPVGGRKQERLGSCSDVS